MPLREVPLVTGEYYHVFNRGITDLQTFANQRDYKRFTDTFKYYQLVGKKPRFSYFMRLPESRKKEIFTQIMFTKSVEILSYCLMPNHFHFLVKQITDKGLTKFFGLITNSYTRYFNTKKRRIGAVFQGRFKAVRINSEEQLIHVSRYIHLNPYSAGIVKFYRDLENYTYSDFPEYIAANKQNLISNILRTSEKYREFVLSQADHQRQIERIKHLTIDLEYK